MNEIHKVGALLDRRSVLERMALLLGVTVLPIEALAAAGEASPSVLSVPQSALLAAVADALLPTTDTPGALEAGVPARFEGLLVNWASVETRIGLIGALDRIESASLAQTLKSFNALSPTGRSQVLRAHDAASLASVPAPAGARAGAGGASLFAGPANVVDRGYLRLKELMINLYYYSAIAGQTELPYVHVPGAWQPSIRLTEQSRPQLNPMTL